MLLYLFIILLIAVLAFLHIKDKNSMSEGYSNYKLPDAMGAVPCAETNVLVQDFYPPIGKNQISSNTSEDIWWHYPIFEVGSYEQITNNIRYPNNPDEGTCMPASMCGALYHEKQLKTNYISPLPPINPNEGTRIGYFTTDTNMLPFRSNMQNILY
jgi:hypothetical protein